jgi:hypothetical protein
MSENIDVLRLKFEDYAKKGLYLRISDSKVVDLTIERIEQLAGEYWQNVNKLPANVKEAIEFQRCPFCPLKGEKSICDAIRPILPLIEDLGNFVSFQNVIALFKDNGKEVLHLANTTMQSALRYVSIVSLIYFCQAAKKYQKYFSGVIPLMNGKKVAREIYLNIYWYHKGKKEDIEETISKFNKVLFETSQNQVKRLNLLPVEDGLKNAYVNTHIISELLSIKADKLVEETFI